MQVEASFIEGHDHFLTKPMFEVFCITIHPKHINGNDVNHLREGEPCAVRGIARVLDEDGTTYDLYNRKADNLELVPSGGFLSITGCCIVPFQALKFEIMLYDTTRDIEIANGIFDLDYSEDYEHNRAYVQKVEGQHGFASVYHATFQHAITAFVDRVELHNQVGSNEVYNTLSGTIIARLERIYGNSSPDADNEFPCTILFNKTQNADESKYSPAQFHTPIKLLRSCVAVPIDCSLVIEADFCDNTGTKIAMAIQLKPSLCGVGKDVAAAQNFELRVEVNWRHGYDAFPRETKLIENTDFADESEPQVSCDAEQPSTLYDILASVGIKENNTMPPFPEAQQPSLSNSRRKPRAAIPVLSSCVEVYSILICAPIKELDIYGKIEMTDSACCPFYIFDGNARLCDRKTLPIVGPDRSFNDKPFTIHVDLKDGKGSVISKGYFRWNCDDEDPISLYDRYISSVIRGDIGYAVVHYSMITYGAQVGIRMSFVSQYCPHAFVNVYGTVTGQYKKYRYQTQYDEQYYKSTLFSKPLEECAQVQLKSALPLLKSVVSVPLEDSLILDVNLKVSDPFVDDNKMMGNADMVDDDVHALVEFNADVNRSYIIHKVGYVISISVTVSDVIA